MGNLFLRKTFASTTTLKYRCLLGVDVFNKGLKWDRLPIGKMSQMAYTYMYIRMLAQPNVDILILIVDNLLDKD